MMESAAYCKKSELSLHFLIFQKPKPILKNHRRLQQIFMRSTKPLPHYLYKLNFFD